MNNLEPIKDAANMEALINVYININRGNYDPLDGKTTMAEIVEVLAKYYEDEGAKDSFLPIDGDFLTYEDYQRQYQILKNACENNPDFANLIIDNQKNIDGGMYAATFKDSSSNSVHVAFSGTKSDEWLPNGNGLSGLPKYVDGSSIQKLALEYFDKIMEEHARYFEGMKIYLTGHSTGGNRAQYITLRSKYRDRITACFSFDGQGMSPEFIEWYMKEYGEAAFKEAVKKMYGLNGKDDYVNILGIAIIPDDQLFYFETPSVKNPIAHHFWDVYLNENGEFNQQTERGSLSNFLAGVSEKLMLLDPETRGPATNALMLLLQGDNPSIDVNGNKLEVNISSEEIRKGLEAVLPILIEELKTDAGSAAIAGIIKDLSGVELPKELTDKVAEILADSLAGLPANVLADVVAGIGDGSMNWPAVIATVLSAIPTALSALVKQGIKLNIDAISYGANAIIDNITNQISLGIENIGNSIKNFVDFSSGLLNGALSIISDLHNICSKLLTNTLVNFKSILPPEFHGAVTDVENFIKTIDWAVQGIASMSKNLISSIHNGLMWLVDGAATVASNAVNAIGGFISNIIEVTTDFAKGLTEVVFDAKVAITKAVKEISWDAMKFLGQAARNTFESYKDGIKAIGDTISAIPQRVANAMSEFTADLISYLPKNALASFLVPAKDVIADLMSGKGINWEKVLEVLPGGIITALSAIPAGIAAAYKQVTKLTIEAITHGTKGLIDIIANQVSRGVENLGNLVKGFSNFYTGLIDGAISAISDLVNIMGKFLADTLEATKILLPPGFQGAITAVQNFINNIIGFVQEVANRGKSLLNSIKNGVHRLVDGVTSFVSGAVETVSGFVNNMVDATANFTKGLTDFVADTTAGIIKSVVEISWDVRKFLEQAAKSAFEGYKNNIMDVLKSLLTITDAAKSAYEGEVSAVKGASKAVRKFIGALAVLGLLIHDSSLAANVKAPSSIGIQSEGRSGANVANATSGRASVNIKSLRELKRAAEDLLNELLKPQHTNVIRQARTHANNAINRHNQSYVRSDANNIFTVCNELETARSRVCADLRTEIFGLGKVIDGYLELEASFV